MFLKMPYYLKDFLNLNIFNRFKIYEIYIIVAIFCTINLSCLYLMKNIIYFLYTIKI